MRHFILVALVFITCLASAQNASNDSPSLKPKKFRDTLDNKFDVSNWLKDANGFIPLPQIITEPALGGFGFMIAPVFIKPNKYQEEGKYTAPNITAAFGGYTANDTWGTGIFRMASLPKHKLKYRIGAAYGNVNMDYYRDIPNLGEAKFSFNFKILPVFGSIMKEVSNNFFVGIEYLYMHTDVEAQFPIDVPPPILEFTKFSSNISTIGLGLEYDTRDNIFTPNKGTLIGVNFRINDSWTGSDYTFQNLNATLFQYFQFNSKWISGFRLDTKFQFDDAPFFMKPSIALRGVPAARYQGSSIYVIETEQRYDFSLRWSVVGFTGLGQAFEKNSNFNDPELVYNYGVGLRYLIARIFKLRMGVDVAKSNNDWGYYITFGSAWNR